jgi:hypothetical protein
MSAQQSCLYAIARKRPLLRAARARGDLAGAAAAEFGDRGQFTRRRPGCEPPPGLEHADELVVSDPIQAAGPDVADEPAQRHAGWQAVGDAAGREPRASPGIG